VTSAYAADSIREGERTIGKLMGKVNRRILRYALSYRDLEEIERERGLPLDHTTIYRWVQAYAPKLEKRIRPQLRLTNDSYRVDETYVKTGAKRKFFRVRFVISSLLVHIKVSRRFSATQAGACYSSYCNTTSGVLSLFSAERLTINDRH
jgi:hypothetical protein